MENLHQEEKIVEVLCPNCEHPIPNGAKFCMECGALLQKHNSVSEDASEEIKTICDSESLEFIQTSNQVQQAQRTTKPKRKLHIFSWVVASFFMISGLAFWPGISSILFILLAIYLCPIKKIREIRNRCVPYRWLRGVVGIILFVIIMTTIPSTNTVVNESSVPTSSIENTSETTEAIIENAEVIAETNEVIAETNEVIVETTSEIINVFFVDLVNNIDEYEGKLIETTVPIKNVFSDGTIHADIASITSKNISIETEDEKIYEKLRGIKFVTVQGMVELNGIEIVIRDPEIIYFGEGAPDSYLKYMSEYEAMIIEGKIAERDEFISNAQTVSYEELRRNPDTYNGQPLKMTIYVTEVEIDGWVFPGAIWAQYNGHEVIVYDEREVREPRLLNGDTITIYAEGNGLSAIQTYEKGTGLFGSDLGANVVDEREEPCVSMRYTDKDDVSKFSFDTINAEESDYYYQKGHELGEKLNSFLEEID